VAVQEHAVDPFDHRGGGRVGRQGVQARAQAGLGGVGMRPGVDQAVAVGWAAAEEAAVQGGLGAMAARPRVLTRIRSLLDMLPNRVIARS
jgi:hypothetical protein